MVWNDESIALNNRIMTIQDPRINVYYSDDPAAIIAMLGKDADDERLRKWVRACERENDHVFGERVWPNWEHPDTWASCIDYPYELPFAARCDLLRCLFPPPFRGLDMVPPEQW